MKEKFDKINKLISESKNILIVAHRSPDEDAVGSALALKLAFKKQGIESSIFIDSYSPREYRFLPGYNLINSKLDNYEFDLVFALDYGDSKRLSIDPLIEKKNPKIVTFDHHLGTGKNHIGEIKILKQASSTTELIYCFLKESGWSIDRDIATCILAGIICDTNGFFHANTSHKAMTIVAELSFQGLGINKVIKQVLNNNNLVAMDSNILTQVIDQVEKYPELNLAYLIIKNSNFKTWHKTDFNNLISAINSIGDCRWALLLVEYEKGKTKASLRSEEYKGVDVSKIASLFGGGGHKLAAAFRIDKKPEKVFNEIIRKSRRILA